MIRTVPDNGVPMESSKEHGFLLQVNSIDTPWALRDFFSMNEQSKTNGAFYAFDLSINR